MRVLSIFGARPEAIKMAPLAQAPGVESVVCVSGQHRGMLEQALPQHHARFARVRNPYGDGQAAARIVAALTGQPFHEFTTDDPHVKEMA